MWLLLFILVLLAGIELFYFRIADRFNIIDKPNERSSHKRITLRGGGVIFLFGAWLYAAFYGFQYPWFLAGLTLIAAISFADDVHSIPNKIRIVVHFAAMLLMFYQLGLFSAGQGWYLFLAWIVCTGIINAYNFMDGINGITGGYSLAVLAPLAVVNVREQFVDPPLIYVTVLSALVFCWFNFRPKARCFAGDVGAVSMAFILLFMLGTLILRTGNLCYLVFLVVYGVDSVLTICHRLLLRENIFEAHRKHAYQLMANELKIPHVVVSAVYALLQVVISFGAIYLPVNGWVYFGIVVVLLSIAYVLFKMKYYCLHEAYLQTKR
jgi:putative phosphate transferase